MAILERETGEYYKVIFEECMIKGRNVFASYAVYKSAREREKEKIREPQITAFKNIVRIKLQELYDIMIFELNKLGVSPENACDSNDSSLVDEKRFPEIFAIQKERHNLMYPFLEIEDKMYSFGDYIPVNISEESINMLEQYGFKREWIYDPICLSGTATVNCGEYHGEELSANFYYERLKKVMNNIMDY